MTVLTVRSKYLFRSIGANHRASVHGRNDAAYMVGNGDLTPVTYAAPTHSTDGTAKVTVKSPSASKLVAHARLVASAYAGDHACLCGGGSRPPYSRKNKIIRPLKANQPHRIVILP